METFEAIRTVLAIRKFRQEPVPDEIVHEIIEAGHLTASSQNGQPWHFIVVRDQDTLRKLADRAPTGRYIAQAPLAVVVGITESRFAVSDASRAIQSMILAAWSRGVGSNWVGFHHLDAVRLVLGIPDSVEVLAIVPFGYSEQPVTGSRKNRKPLSEVAHSERFGQPFA